MIVFDRGVYESSILGSAEVLSIEDIYALLEVNAALTDAEKVVVQQSMVAAWGAIRRYLGYDPVIEQRTEFYPQMDFSSLGGGSRWESNDTHAYMRQTNGGACNQLQLSHIPVRSIVSLRIDYDGRGGSRSGSFGDATEKTEGVDFWRNTDTLDGEGEPMSRDGILFSHGLWPLVPGSVKITYLAGYRATELRGEDAITDASLIRESLIDETIRRLHRNESRAKRSATGFSGPLTSENLGDYSYSVDSTVRNELVAGGDLSKVNCQRLEMFRRCDLGVL
jgi:hypothetical protein